MNAPSEKTKALDSSEIEFVDAAAVPTKILDQKEKLGRYELVYELGTGGMANVYLARARGPAGFHKFFAIKRIHPHLEKDDRFVNMFLDEARIAAAVHHPNVAQVFDLGEEKGHHFIAMEYLHGEHLGAVCLRSVNQFGRVPFALAARIMSAASDGLHHAHEVKGSGGKALGLVHRDVSPQNIFITYDGQVKMTDFGIAKAADRITHTRTGSMKGKVSYMAPEQALGQEVDRRADIFALGIVLWEATVGRRLFRAETDAQTLMRITSGRVRTPSSVVSHYPPELEAIVMRALATKATDRYPTAAVMARDLDRYIATTGAPAGATELGAMMAQLFGDRIAAKEQLLRSDPETASLIDVPSQPRGADASSGSGALPMESSRSEVVIRGLTRRRGSRPRAMVMATLLAGAAAVALWAVMSAGGGSVVRIDTDPSGARVLLDGEPVEGTTPVLLEGIADGRHRLRLELQGLPDLEPTFDAEGDRVDLSYRFLRGSGPVAAPPSVATAGPAEEGVPEPMEDPHTDEGRAAAPAEGALAEPLVAEEAAAPVAEEAAAPVAEAAPAKALRSARPRAARPRPAAERPPAYLNLITRPWASVTVDGHVAGSTPLFRHPIPSGRVRIQLRAEGTGAPRALVIRAAPGATVSRSLDL